MKWAKGLFLVGVGGFILWTALAVAQDAAALTVYKRSDLELAEKLRVWKYAVLTVDAWFFALSGVFALWALRPWLRRHWLPLALATFAVILVVVLAGQLTGQVRIF